MSKIITSYTVKEWIARAKTTAAAEKAILKKYVRCLFIHYLGRSKKEDEIDLVMKSLDYVYSGEKFTRDELNERNH
jgi:hypothetical protein